MKLENKKELVGRALGVGRNRIIFNKERLAEIKEAITKQDIRDLLGSGAIYIKEVRGRKHALRKNKRRRAGSIRKKVIDRKREYLTFTRKMRAYLIELRKQEIISQEQFIRLRKDVRARHIKNKAQLREVIAQRIQK